MKRIFLLLIILFISSCAPHNQDDPPLLPIDFSLSLSKSKLKINEQSKFTIKLEDDKDGERANFTYKSSDENVLKPIDFKDNVITLSAVSIGTATITVTETNYQTEKSVNLEVNGINITLNKDFLNLTKNNTFQLETNVSDVTFESSDNNVATVTNTGLVTAINNGDATIKVSYNPMPNSFATCEVSVSEILPEKTIIKQSYKEYGKNQYWFNYASAPSIGEINLLIIPIWFTESTTYIAEKYKSSIREDIELAYLGSNEEIGYRSVKTYYEEESGKKLNWSFTVKDITTDSNNHSTATIVLNKLA